jgi:uncharacterized protein YbdZ (MbtH family)
MVSSSGREQRSLWPTLSTKTCRFRGGDYKNKSFFLTWNRKMKYCKQFFNQPWRDLRKEIMCSFHKNSSGTE